MKKVLLYLPICSYPPKGGPEISVHNTIKALSEVSETTCFIATDLEVGSESYSFVNENSFSLKLSPVNRFISGKAIGRKASRRIRRALGLVIGLIDAISVLESLDRYDYVWVDRVIEHGFYFMVAIKLLKPGIVVVGDTESVYSDFIRRELPYSRGIVRRGIVWAKYLLAMTKERIMSSMADKITFVSQTDSLRFEELHSNDRKKSRIFPNVVDISLYSRDKPPIRNQSIKKEPRVVLMGTFGHKNSPMDQAADWLLNDIWREVAKEYADMEVLLIGKGSGNVDVGGSIAKNVRRVGEIDSIVDCISSNDICVVPLRHESGTRFKILEAGAIGMGCVSTSLGAEGLDVNDMSEICIEDTPAGFANAIVKLAKDSEMRESFGINLKKRIEKSYSIVNLTSQAKDILQER